MVNVSPIFDLSLNSLQYTTTLQGTIFTIVGRNVIKELKQMQGLITNRRELFCLLWWINSPAFQSSIFAMCLSVSYAFSYLLHFPVCLFCLVVKICTSQCQQQETPFTIFFLSPGLQGKLQIDSGTDLSPPDHCISSTSTETGGDIWTGGGRETRRLETWNIKPIDICFVQSASYIESQVIGPLANDMVPWVAVVGHLKLEDVVTTRSISILIEHNTRTCTSC